MCNRIKYIVEKLFSEIASGTVKSCFWQVTCIHLTTYIYPKVIARVTWVIAMLFPQSSTRHYTILFQYEQTCTIDNFLPAALLTKIRIQGKIKYSFAFKLHLMILSIRNISFSSAVHLKTLDVVFATLDGQELFLIHTSKHFQKSRDM